MIRGRAKKGRELEQVNLRCRTCQWCLLALLTRQWLAGFGRLGHRHEHFARRRLCRIAWFIRVVNRRSGFAINRIIRISYPLFRSPIIPPHCLLAVTFLVVSTATEKSPMTSVSPRASRSFACPDGWRFACLGFCNLHGGDTLYPGFHMA